jgi:hypothetical protein
LTSFVGALTSSLGLGISKKDHGPSAPNQLEARMKTKSAPTNGTNSTKIAPEIVTSVRYSAKVSTGHKASPTVTTDHTNQLIPTVSRWHERTLDSQCTPTPSACRSTICGSSRFYDFDEVLRFAAAPAKFQVLRFQQADEVLRLPDSRPIPPKVHLQNSLNSSAFPENLRHVRFRPRYKQRQRRTPQTACYRHMVRSWLQIPNGFRLCLQIAAVLSLSVAACVLGGIGRESGNRRTSSKS